MAKLSGNFLILHPTEDYTVEQLPLKNGAVNIISYSNGAVVVQTIEEGSSIGVWSNKVMDVNPANNEITLRD